MMNRISFFVKVDKESEKGEIIYVLEQGDLVKVNDITYNLEYLNSGTIKKIGIIEYKKGFLNYSGKLKDLLEIKEVLKDLKLNNFKVNNKIEFIGNCVSLDVLLNKYQSNVDYELKNDLRVVKGYIANICESDFKKFKYIKAERDKGRVLNNELVKGNLAELIYDRLNKKSYKKEMEMWVESVNKGEFIKLKDSVEKEKVFKKENSEFKYKIVQYLETLDILESKKFLFKYYLMREKANYVELYDKDNDLLTKFSDLRFLETIKMGGDYFKFEELFEYFKDELEFNNYYNEFMSFEFVY